MVTRDLTSAKRHKIGGTHSHLGRKICANCCDLFNAMYVTKCGSPEIEVTATGIANTGTPQCPGGTCTQYNTTWNFGSMTGGGCNWGGTLVGSPTDQCGNVLLAVFTGQISGSTSTCRFTIPLGGANFGFFTYVPPSAVSLLDALVLLSNGNTVQTSYDIVDSGLLPAILNGHCDYSAAVVTMRWLI